MENTNFSQEFPGATDLAPEQVATEGVSTELPVVQEPKEKETYELADGSTGSRAAFIREKFINENMSRKEIAEVYGFPYRVVYSATVNMVNDAEATTRGRAATNATIKVNAANQLVEVKEIEGSPVTFVNGEAVDMTYADEDLIEKSRNEWIKEQVDAGMSRGDVAKILDLSYGVVYGLTKEAEGTRTAHTVELEDGTTVSRAEYIRQRAAAGVSRGDIAKELGVPYSVVWQATKTEKTAQEKYEELVKSLEAFADKMDDKDAFDSAVAVLKELTVATAEQDEQADAEAAAVAEASEM